MEIDIPVRRLKASEAVEQELRSRGYTLDDLNGLLSVARHVVDDYDCYDFVTESIRRRIQEEYYDFSSCSVRLPRIYVQPTSEADVYQVIGVVNP